MKIIIFTYKHSNYGAVLQCYALYHYLVNSVSDNVRVLDYTTIDHIKGDAIFKKRSTSPIKQLAYLLMACLRFVPLLKRRKRTLKFKEQNIIFTDRYSSKEEVVSNVPRADIYITGSDQVFNIESDNMDVYYLNFPKLNARKVAYAPSFGTSTFTDATKNRISHLLRDFDALSCREDDGAAFISSITNGEVPTVLDPTLLLDKEDWLKISKYPSYNKKYILIYDLNGGERLVAIAKKIQHVTRLPIVCITDKINKFYDVAKQIYSAGPAEFLGWFAMASYVVTDSFHGTVFSIQLDKPFFTYIAVRNSSARIVSLLSKLNLSSRIVWEEQLDFFSFNEDNYIVDETLLRALRLSSEKFIKNNCKVNG